MEKFRLEEMQLAYYLNILEMLHFDKHMSALI